MTWDSPAFGSRGRNTLPPLSRQKYRQKNARAERRKALAGSVLCGKRAEDLSAPPSHRHSVSPFRMEDPLRDPLRKNDDLRRHCAKTCPRARPFPPIRPRRRKRRRKKSHLPHHPLPPRHRQERPPHRLRRRPSPKSLSPRDGEKTGRYGDVRLEDIRLQISDI